MSLDQNKKKRNTWPMTFVVEIVQEKRNFKNLFPSLLGNDFEKKGQLAEK